MPIHGMSGAKAFTLLSTTFLTSLADFTLLTHNVARAACSTNVANLPGEVIECTNVDNVGVTSGGFSGITVNIQDGGSITLNNGGHRRRFAPQQ